MIRLARLTAVVPAVLVAGFVVAAAGFVVLLSHPETVIRAALDSPAQHNVLSVVVDADKSEPSRPKPLEFAAQDESAVSLDVPEAIQPDAVQQVGLSSSFAVGDRLTISREDGRLRTLVVVEVRRLGALINKVADTNAAANWVMIISKDMDHPSAPKVQFLVQDGAGLPFGIKRDDGRAL